MRPSTELRHLRDQRTVLSVSSLAEDFDGVGAVCLSLPTIVGRGGVEHVLRLELSAEERAGLRRSAETSRAMIDEVRRAGIEAS
jgi:L-lactate dehydrogenase